MHVSKLFIFIGEDRYYFTLRESYMDHFTTPPKVKYMHICNLSHNADEAIEKAKAYSEKMGIELCASKTVLEQQLEELKLRSAAERAAALEQDRINKEREEAARLAWEQKQIALVNAGIIPFGQYANLNIIEAPLSYLCWAVKTDFDSAVWIALRSKIVELKPNSILPEAIAGQTMGVVGSKIETKITVIKRASFDSIYGRVNVVSMVAEDGSLLVSMGKFFADVGQRLLITATVKCHEEYRDVMQTKIKRIKVIESYTNENYPLGKQAAA